MKTKFAESNKVMNLPILKHFEGSDLATTANPLDSFRKGEKGMFNVFKLLLIGAVGYLSWVYVLPPLFQALGQIIAVAGSVVLIVALIFLAPVILKAIRRFTRFAHKMVIKHDPFGELEEQKQKLIANVKNFVKSHAGIKKLQMDMEIEAKNSEESAKRLQSKIVSGRTKIKDLKERQDELKKTPEGKSSNEYVNNHASLIKLGAAVQRDMFQKEQQTDFIRKYGVRAQTMQKLDHKLVLVKAQMDIKVLDFDATIDILKKDYEFAQKSREATDTARSAMMFTEGWEVEYALDVVTSTIAQDIAITAANISDIDSFTTMYSMDDDELYLKLDELADDIIAGKDEIPSSKQYSNPDYKQTREDKLQSGGFGQQLF